MKLIRLTASSVLLLAMLVIAVTPAGAASSTFGFDCFTNNLVGDAAIGEAQLGVQVTDTWEGKIPDANQVMFTFYNVGPLPSSITDVYFDDGALLGIAAIDDDPPLVDFIQYANPPDLPSGQNLTPPFQTTAGFSAQSESPTQPLGVNPGEHVHIIFNLVDGLTYDDVLTALTASPSENFSLRIGIHVQGFASGGSESCVNRPPTAITLASFEARAAGNAVSLEWVTGTEISNAGFNLYRATAEGGARTKVNSELLAASGDATSGASYSYVDNPGYGTFYYWLEDVEFTGATALHGPVTVTLESPIRRPLHRPVLPGSN